MNFKAKKKYQVVTKVDSSVKTADSGKRIELTYNLPDTPVLCVFSDNYFVDESGTEFHKETYVEVTIEADNINEAIEKSNAIANFFLTTISWTEKTNINRTYVHLAYDVTLGITDREFVQFFYNLNLPPAKRKLETDRLEKILHNLQGNEFEDRLVRAMDWFRKYMTEENELDKFVNLWTALEALNNPIVKKFDVTYDKALPEAIIPKYIFLLRKTFLGHRPPPKEIIGIRYLFENHVADGKKLYQNIRKTRVGLLHGFEKISTLVSEARQLNQQLEYAVTKAILLLLDMPPEEHTDWMKKPLTNLPLPYIKVGALLHESNPKMLGKSGQHPHFKDERIILSTDTKADGSTTMSLKNELKPEFGCSSYTPRFVEMYGPDEGYTAKIETQN